MAVTGTPAQGLDQALDRIATDLGLSRAEIATVLGITPEVLRRWRTGRAHPEGEAARRLIQLQDLHRHLRETFESPTVIPVYLRSGLRYLGGMTPLDALLAGRIDHVEAALDALDSGIFI